ncbi:MAG TPA: hypothetical protein VNA13_03950, partial [Xanthomonadales bacterium]|nr:hypothetical protein [Xanthomonadales bacterium]
MQATLLVNKFGTYLSEISSQASNADGASTSGSGPTINMRSKKMKRFFRNSKMLPFLIVGGVI